MHLGVLLAVPGSYVGPFGGHVETMLGAFWLSWRLPKAMLGHLEAMLGHLEAMLELSWTPWGSLGGFRGL